MVWVVHTLNLSGYLTGGLLQVIFTHILSASEANLKNMGKWMI